MATKEDYSRVAARLNARPDRGGILGMAVRMRDAMANRTLPNQGVLGMAQAMRPQQQPQEKPEQTMKRGGKVKKMAGGGAVAMPKSSDMGSMNMKKGGCVKMTRGGGVARKGVGRGRVC